MSEPLSYEQSTELVKRIASRDPDDILDYLDEQQAHPVAVAIFLGHFAASLVGLVLKKDPADAEQFLAIEAPEGTEIPLYMQYVTNLVNDDDETAKALFAVIAQTENTMKTTIVALFGMVADLMGVLAERAAKGSG